MFVCLADVKNPQSTLQKFLNRNGQNWNWFYLDRGTVVDTGGVLFLYKAKLAQFVTVERQHAVEGILWVKIAGQAFGLQKDLYISTCYLAPENSPVYQRHGLTIDDCFAVLSRDIKEFKSIGHVLLGGDMNCHIGERNEHHNQLSCLARYVEVGPSEGDSIDLPPRNSCCTQTVSDRGEQFLALCIECELCICNGRLFGDQNGRCTFVSDNKEVSVVDFVVCDFDIYNMCTQFAVLDIPKVVKGGKLVDVSDHRPLSFGINTTGCVVSNLDTVEEDCSLDFVLFSESIQTQRVRWCADRAEQFIDALLLPESQAALQAWAQTAALATQDTIDEVVREFTEIVTKAAIAAGMEVKPRRVSSRAKQALPSQPWFDKGCRSLRAAALDEQSNVSTVLRQRYFRQIRKLKYIYEVEFNNSLMKMARKNPRKFWQLLKSAHETLPKQLSKGEVKAYFEKLLNPTCQQQNSAADQSAEQHSMNRTEVDETLCRPFGLEDVLQVLRGSNNNKSVSEGLTVEFFKCARVETRIADPVTGKSGQVKLHVLAEHLLTLFNKCFVQEIYPVVWNTGVISPVFKKKDPVGQVTRLNLNNYRGITIATALYKVFATMLDKRLSAWAERNGLRAVGQAGFRKGYSCADHVLVLRQLTDRARLSNSKLFCCFVDMAKAFDSVKRSLLWDRLRSLGVGGHMLQTVENMYLGVKARVKIAAGELTDEFEVCSGVKQGCPLSPTIFGLFIDEFETVIKERYPRIGALLNSQRVSLLTYADDIVLIALSENDLQLLLDELQQFCQSHQLTINMDKTEVVVFRNASSTKNYVPVNASWHINGKIVKVQGGYCYLGIWFDQFKSVVQSAKDFLCSATIKQKYALLSKFKDKGVKVVAVKQQVFDSIVKPKMTYLAEVWGVNENSAVWDRIFTQNQLEKQYLDFHRFLLGLDKKCRRELVMAEYGKYPLCFTYWKNCLSYWNKIVEQGPQRLPYEALVDSILCYNSNLGGSRNYPVCWFSAFVKLMKLVDISVSDLFHTENGLIQLKQLRNVEQDLVEKLRLKLDVVWDKVEQFDLESEQVPKDVGYKNVVYKKCFWQERESLCPYLQLAEINAEKVKVLARFRMGQHRLAVETGRYSKPKVSRRDRACCVCGSNQVEDENHLVFHCPAYEPLREQYHELFDYADNLLKFSASKHVFKLVNFVYKCFDIRQAILGCGLAQGPGVELYKSYYQTEECSLKYMEVSRFYNGWSRLQSNS